MEIKYLVYVDSAKNSNKFYEMIPDSDGSGFTVKYGRIGGKAPATVHYDASKFYEKYYQKLERGYVDQTALVKTSAATQDEEGFKDLSDKDTAKFVKNLRQYANDVIKQNYTISEKHITKQMIDQAEQHLKHLGDITSDYQDFNNTLLELFKTLPRKMTKVSDYFAKSADDIKAIMTREWNLFNIVKANFETSAASTNGNDDKTQTILEKFGLEFRKVTPQEEQQIKDHMGQAVSKYDTAWRIVNKKTQEKFDAFCQKNNVKPLMFFHGSRNENWWNIIKNGLQLNPNAKITGKMLGHGIYLAPQAIKSINYTSLRGSYWSNGSSDKGLLAIFDAAVQKDRAYEVSSSSEISECRHMTYDKLQKIKPGATHVYAHGGSGNYLRADELAVYNEDQCTLHYLIELKF